MDDFLYVVPGGFEVQRNENKQFTQGIATVSGADGVSETGSQSHHFVFDADYADFADWRRLIRCPEISVIGVSQLSPNRCVTPPAGVSSTLPLMPRGDNCRRPSRRALPPRLPSVQTLPAAA